MRPHSLRALSLVVSLAVLAGCGGGKDQTAATPGVVRHLDSASVAALPVDSLVPGHRVCLATGYDSCPLHFAIAARLGPSEIALWEPGHLIGLLSPNDSLPRALGAIGGPGASYATVMAIRKQKNGYEIVDVEGGLYGFVRLDANGVQLGRTALPQLGPLATMGFLGGDIVVQDFRGWEGGGTGRLVVRRLKSESDTVGTTIFEAPVDWMTGGTTSGPPTRPLFASSPLWTRVAGGDVIWAPGDSFRIERRAPSPTGAVAWVLDGPAGPPVTTADLDLREKSVRDAMTGLPFSEEEFASMRQRSDSLIPPISGFVPFPDGGLLVMGALAPSMPMTTWLRLDATGTPVSRFSLDSRARILLAEGDSVLVHRPTESEPWEVLWMKLAGSRK